MWSAGGPTSNAVRRQMGGGFCVADAIRVWLASGGGLERDYGGLCSEDQSRLGRLHYVHLNGGLLAPESPQKTCRAPDGAACHNQRHVAGRARISQWPAVAFKRW